MNKFDRLLIGALVLGVWASVAIQFLDAFVPAIANNISRPYWVTITNEPLEVRSR